MRCPNCNDVKKKSDQDDIFCDYCYEASVSNRALVFGEGEESPIQFLQKTAHTADNGVATGSIILWNGPTQIPDGFEVVTHPNFAGQNSDFANWNGNQYGQISYPYGSTFSGHSHLRG